MVFVLGTAGVSGDEIHTAPGNGTVIFLLTDYGDSSIQYVSLMKSGENSKDGMTRQTQNMKFIRESDAVIWTPCNENACMVASSPTAGGTGGRDELILSLTLQNPHVDVRSCYGDPTCERLKGGTSKKSGMIDGIFYTGRMYEISIASLQPGIRETFEVTEILA
jgi:hypothetical protein